MVYLSAPALSPNHRLLGWKFSYFFFSLYSALKLNSTNLPEEMIHGRERYLAVDNGVAKYPYLRQNISDTKESRDRAHGGCEFCYAARSAEALDRTSLCKVFFGAVYFSFADHFQC